MRPKASTIIVLVAIFIFKSAMIADERVHPDLIPLQSAAPDGLGPAALPTLRHTVLGYAYVYGSERPDLFVYGSGRLSGLYLYPWVADDDEGRPIFDRPRRVANAVPHDRGTVFETADGTIHALWVHGRELLHSILDRDNLRFRPYESLRIEGLPGSVQSIAAFSLHSESYLLALEVNGHSVPARSEETNASSEDWRPFDAAGVSTCAQRYRFVVYAILPKLFEGPVINQGALTPTDREVFWGFMQISPLDIESSGGSLITGSRMGNFHFYQFSYDSELNLVRSGLLVSTSGRAIRHPSKSASVFSYPRRDKSFSDIIAGGEGSLYFYKNTGQRNASGIPIFEEPQALMQRNADLFSGTLPAPSVYDWNGNGKLDIIVGNSEGFLLFHENVGTNEEPAFLPGVPLEAGGRVIQVQAGYSGSVQGMREARWGYVSPKVVDWTENGLPDIVMSDITGNYTVLINKGEPGKPMLDPPQPIYSYGIDLRGMWRSRPAIGKMGDRLVMVIADGDNQMSLFEKLDDFNVRFIKKLKLDDGSLIGVTVDPAGGTGRCKLSFYDWNGNGKLDLIIGTGRRGSIPNLVTGFPHAVLGHRTLNTPLVMENVGTDENPVFAHPKPFAHVATPIVQPGGSHESGVVATTLGGGSQPNLLAGNEAGRLFILRRENLRTLSLAEASEFRNSGNKYAFPVID